MPDFSAKSDRIFGLIVILIGAFLFWETFGFPKTDWEQLGMAFWPRLVLGLLGIIAVFFIIKGRVGTEPADPISRRALIFVGGCLLYFFLLRDVGYLILTPAYLFATTLWLRGRSKSSCLIGLASAVIGTSVIYGIFHYGLLVEFPMGPFDAGY